MGPVAQSVRGPTVDPGIASLIPAWSHALVEFDYEILYGHSPLPLIQ